MKLKDLFLDQLEKEAASTRRALERVPEGRNDWKPHEKSMLLGYLAALVATMPAWIAFMINQDELDLISPGSAKFRPQVVSSSRDLGASARRRCRESARGAGQHDRRTSYDPVEVHNRRQGGK